MLARLVAMALLGLLWNGALGQSQPPDRAQRPYLGIQAEPPSDKSDRTGVRVHDVTPGSPAEKAGLKSGDEITKVDDRAVKDFDDLINMLENHKAGDKLKLQVRRDGKDEKVSVTLGDRPARREGRPGGRRTGAQLGVVTRPLTPEDSDRAGVKADSGVIVMEVVSGSPAADAGLKPGDVITALDNKNISNPDDLREAIRQDEPGKEVTLKVARGKETKELKAKLQAASEESFYPPPPFGGPGDVLQRLEQRLQRLEKRLQDLEQKQSERSGSKPDK
ncbi:MAG: PDZ domain-containing protein [Gemmataceae bacterium]